MAGLQDQRKKTSSSSTIPLLGFVTSAFFSSSCCLVQVLLNALSLSCAGFQVLTPYKRIWWMTTCAFGWIWWRKTNRKLGARGMVVLALAIVTLSEEALSFANSGGLQRASSGERMARELVQFLLWKLNMSWRFFWEEQQDSSFRQHTRHL